MATQIQLQSTNYNGQLADITFYPCSGGSISLGVQTIPYTYTNDYYEGTYDLFFSAFSQTCQLVISCPTPTPTTTTTPTVTPTNTPTVTPTNTSSPTPTPTLTPTPSPVVEYHLQAENGDNILAENNDFIDIETPTTTYTVTNSGSSAYIINGGSNPTLTLMRGQTYTFNINAVGHPFWIKTVSSTGTGNQYNTGVTNNGTDNGTITWVVDAGAPSTLYYNCQIHIAMAGTINIV